MFEFFAGIKHFQKHKQHTSKDAEFIAVHDHATSTTRFKCYNTLNDKIQQLYADTNKLHKCLKSLLQLNIFKNTYNTHQKMQNSSLYTIKDSSATRFKCYNTSNDKIQQLYADTNKLHKCLNLFATIKHFQKHVQHTSKDAEFIALHDQGQFCNQIENATLHQTTRFSNCMPTRTNCISVWIFCWN